VTRSLIHAAAEAGRIVPLRLLLVEFKAAPFAAERLSGPSNVNVIEIVDSLIFEREERHFALS